MTAPTIHLIFEPWRPDVPSTQPVHGDWSRKAWLPTLGPTSWLLWTELSAQVEHGPATITTEDLAERVGIAPRRIHAPLDRLTKFRILAEHGPDYYAVRTNAGPLPPGSLRNRPNDVARMQADIFGQPPTLPHLPRLI